MEQGIKNLAKTSLLLILAIGVLAQVGFAAPCALGPIAVSTLSGAGCTYGTITFSNFNLTASTLGAGTPGTSIDPTHVDVTFSTSAGSPLLVNVTFTNDLGGAAWALTGTQQFTLDVTYNVADLGSPPSFIGVGDQVTGSAGSNGGFNTGSVSFNKSASTIILPVIGFMGPTGTTTVSNSINSFAAVNSFAVHDNIQVQASGANVTLVSAVNSFAVTPTPEPMTSMLLGAGLLLMLGIKLRRRRAV